MIVYENVNFVDHRYKLAINGKKDNDVTFCGHDLIIKFFGGSVVFLVKFSYWSKFHVNIMTGSGVMTIFVYNRLTRNPEIGILPFEIPTD